jgi:hypothetical protein
MKKFLVNLYDRSSNARIAQLIVAAANMDEAFRLAVEWKESRKSKKRR